MRKAILVASFGTSHRETCERNIAAVEREIAGAFPDFAVRRAFTSGMIMRKLLKRDSIAIDTVAQALERLAEDGYDTVVVQPTHILNGTEFSGVEAAVAEYTGRFAHLVLGEPLLTTTEDFQQLVKVFSQQFPRETNTALCLMGHGSEHFADMAYAALEYHFRDGGREDIFVGTVEGFPDLDTMLRHVTAGKYSKATLAPFMLVAGDHAVNDMAGDEEDSWKSAFEAAGIETSCVLKGMGEYEGVRRMYTEHVQRAVDRLNADN